MAQSSMDFHLAQKVKPPDANITISESSMVESELFSESLLSIDDTILNAIDLDAHNKTERPMLGSISRSNIRLNMNVDDTSHLSSLIISPKIKKHPTPKKRVASSQMTGASHMHRMTQSREELEDIFNKTEYTLCHKQLQKSISSDSGTENLELCNDSLFDQVFSEMEEAQCSDKDATVSDVASSKRNSNVSLKTIKRKLSPTKSPTPNKRSRPSSDLSPVNRPISTKSTSFYGLPDTVKSLIQDFKGIDKLYEWQDECLNMKAVRERRNLIYALPTSGGKTLVAEILMLREIVCNKRNAIFILPFVAIVQEKVRSLAPFALNLNFLVEEYAAGKGCYPPRKRRRKNTIYVCTIEKGLGLVNSLIETDRLKEIGTVVVDELHLLGETGGRGATLEGLLTKLVYSKNVFSADIHIIGMSATIGNLDEIARFLDAILYTKDFRPVDLEEYLKCENQIWRVDLREEDILTDRKRINYSYSDEATRLDPDTLGGLVMDVAPHDSCLIFCPSRQNCENVAILLTRVLFRSLQEHKKKEKQILLKALASEGAICNVLSKTIPFGVAYHHSGLMTEERRLLEEAFRSGTLCVICCTSTLAAGVNLPARRVILRTPYVGRNFLNLSRYKQMIGRAGRAGMNSVGESILICKSREVPQVKELLTSKMDECISTMHTERGRGINNLVLSAILLNLASTRSDLHKLISTTLLEKQQNKLGINLKKETDSTIRVLMKAGVIKVKTATNYCETKPNITVVIPSQQSPNNAKMPAPSVSNGKKTIKLSKDTTLEISKLGRAAMKGNVDLDRAHILYKDLKKAQSQLVLLDCLHLLYLITPYEVVDSAKPSGDVYFDVVCSLSRIQMETARVIGINEAVLHKIRTGMVPKNVEPRIINRFYFTLILNELWNQKSVQLVSTKYQVPRGLVQNLMNSSAAFASCVERFCAELDEFWAFRDLLHSFGERLSHCCSTELEPLMELPAVRIGRARQLYDAGYKTLQAVASAKPEDICDKVENLLLKNALQIVAAAKLSLLEKVENLRDEAEAVMDGIDPSKF